MGRSQSEIYRMLERLVARQYVSRSLEGDRYALTLKMFALGSRHPPVSRLVSQALPLMDQLSRASKQSCHLGIYDRGAIIIAAQVNSPDNWALTIRLGARIDLLDTGSGRVILAFQGADKQRQMLAEHDNLDVPTVVPADFDQRLSAIRAQGYWRGDSGQTIGVIDISAPILDPDGAAMAVLTCPFIRRVDGHEGLDVDSVTTSLLNTTRAMWVK
jgi:DNA-binding IclR family transcriptional regulator